MPTKNFDISRLQTPFMEHKWGPRMISLVTGQIYRGKRFPEYVGSFIYCGHFYGEFRSLVYDGFTIASNRVIAKVSDIERVQISSFATDATNEFYLPSRVDGGIYTLRRNSHSQGEER